jgi:VWFA-related protein
VTTIRPAPFACPPSSCLRALVPSSKRHAAIGPFIGHIVVFVCCALASVPVAQERPRFKSGANVVSVDVIVRDRATGQLVRDLKPSDFEIREDGRPQEISTFSFQEIATQPAGVGAVELLAAAEAKVAEDARRAAPAPAGATPPAREIASLTPQALAGRRLIVLLFDVSSMQPEDVQRAVESARKYVAGQMASADMVAVATVGSTLTVLTDFTGDRARVDVALGTLAYLEGTATELPEGATAAIEEQAAAEEEAAAEVSELDMFNNDVRLRALKTLAETLAPIEQKKAIVYFSAGMQRSGQDNQVELRATINAAVRANLSIYPIDTRGLQAVVPGGDAREASGRGVSMFSGRGVAQQFSRMSESQATLTSLAADTGGRVFTDSNDFGDAFTRVQRDMAAYYLIGYSSMNAVRDGRFRRIQVRVKREDVRVEARAGYFADRDFAHTSRTDRESQLEEQLFSPVSTTDLPVIVTGGWFRLAADRYYVPISVGVPGAAVTVATGKDEVSLDVLGLVRDEQGRPVGRIRETMRLPAGGGTSLRGKQVLYQSGVTLPPGRFFVKVVVRENSGGTVGSFETLLVVPELKQAALKVSSIVLSTQLQPAAKRSDSPLVRGGLQLLPNLTHVVARDQKLYFYYEVYDPQASEGAAPQLRTSLAFYRGRVKVYETPVVERTRVDAPDRRAAVFQFEVPPDAFTAGLYTCQINIIDAVAGRFAFPRLALYVR